MAYVRDDVTQLRLSALKDELAEVHEEIVLLQQGNTSTYLEQLRVRKEKIIAQLEVLKATSPHLVR